jgi:hypothetical protein
VEAGQARVTCVQIPTSGTARQGSEFTFETKTKIEILLPEEFFFQ